MLTVFFWRFILEKLFLFFSIDFLCLYCPGFCLTGFPFE